MQESCRACAAFGHDSNTGIHSRWLTANRKELARNNLLHFVVRTPWSGRVHSQLSLMISSGPRVPDYITANREVIPAQFLNESETHNETSLPHTSAQ